VNANAITGETNSTASNAFAIVGRVTSASPGGSSAAIRGINNGTGGSGIGIWGSQAGSGYGVFGSAPGGIGVFGVSDSGAAVAGEADTGVGGEFSSNSGPALLVGGPIKVNGSHPAAFVHTAGSGSYITVIDNPETNDNPNAILLVTNYWTAVYNAHPIGVYYIAGAPGHWAIFN
jgi:hypothetical protein